MAILCKGLGVFLFSIIKNYQTFGLAIEQTVLTSVMPLTKSEVACIGAEASMLCFFCSTW